MPPWENSLSMFAEAFRETMEAMVFTEPEPCEPLSWSTQLLFCTIRVESPFQAILFLAVPGELATELAEVAAGVAGVCDATGMAHDAVGEFLNTAAGKFMSTNPDCPNDFTMGLPEFRTPPASVPEAARGFLVNGAEVWVGFFQER